MTTQINTKDIEKLSRISSKIVVELYDEKKRDSLTIKT